jgi:hypothetical protein
MCLLKTKDQLMIAGEQEVKENLESIILDKKGIMHPVIFEIVEGIQKREEVLINESHQGTMVGVVEEEEEKITGKVEVSLQRDLDGKAVVEVPLLVGELFQRTNPTPLMNQVLQQMNP